MPALNNPRHENFAQEVAAGTTLLAAYLASGFRDTGSARFHASRLHSRPEVQARVKEIREGVTDGVVSLEWVQGKIAPMLVADPTQICEPDPENPGRERMRQLRKLPWNLKLAITRIRFDARSGKPVDVYFADKVAAGGLLVRSLTPDALVQQNANITLDLATRLDAALGRLSPEDQRALTDSLEALPAEPGVTSELRPVQIGDRF
jgi:hypothetical protein